MVAMEQGPFKASILQVLQVIALAVLLQFVPVYSQQKSSSTSNAPYGAYLGCFDLARLLYMRGLEGKSGKQYTDGSMRQCMPDCKAQGYSLTILTADYRCWCSISTPDVDAQLPEAACSHVSRKAAAVFYSHDMADTRICRLEAVKLVPNNVNIHYNGHDVKIDAASEVMTLQMEGTSGTRVVPKHSNMLYGQVEVTAMVNGASGVVTAFYMRDSDDYNPENTGNFDEIDFEFLNGNPAVPNSVWLNSYKSGVSGGEYLLKPGEYQKRLALGYHKRANNTFFQYTISWQPSRVTWAMEGIPVLTRKTGQEVKWMDMNGKHFVRNFSSPDKEMHVCFSIWSDQSRYQFGGQLEWGQSPFASQFMDLKRVICDQPITAANAHDRSVRGPAWLYIGSTWDWDNGFVDSTQQQNGKSDVPTNPADGAFDAENEPAITSWNPGWAITPAAPVKPPARPVYRPAPPAPGSAAPGNYSGFTVAFSTRKQVEPAPVTKGHSAPNDSSSGDGSSSSSRASAAISPWAYSSSNSSSSRQSITLAPRVGSVSSSNLTPKCTTSIVPYGVCGGPGLRCRGHKCTDSPWLGHCCQNGFQCIRKAPSAPWTCEPPKDCPSGSSVCKWEVSSSGACGGKRSGCVGCQCRDGAWPGFCCAAGFACTRHDEWHWSCQ